MFIVIDPDGTLSRRDGHANADAIREVVGEPGFAIVRIYSEQQDLCAFVNDEGFRLRPARNPVGACVVASLGASANVYAGPIVITGWDKHANGPEIRDLSAEQADLIERLHDFTRQALDGADVRFVGAENWSGDMRDYAEFVTNADAPVLTVRSFDEVG